MDAQTPVADLVMAGLVSGIPSESYHSWPGVSKTGLDRLAKSPAHYRAYLEEPRQETPALRFGRIFHRFILEPDACRLAVAPHVDRRTKAGKEEYEAFLLESSCCDVVSQDESDQLNRMRDAVYAHRSASALLSGGRAENSRWWYDEQSGELCKCRPDYYREDGFVADLKSTEDASPAEFARSCAKFRYHVQAAFYLDGLKGKHFTFIAVEKSPPYAVGVYVLGAEEIEMGRYMYKRDLMRLAECKISHSWPAYSDRIEELKLPAWAMKE